MDKDLKSAEVIPESAASQADSTKNVQELKQNNQPVATSQNTESVENYPYNDYSGSGEVEEFVYKPKPGFAFKKLFRFIVILFTIALIAAPLIYLALKFKPQGVKTGGKKGEVVWWGYGLKKEIVYSMISDYQKDNPNAKITYIEQSPIDYRERLTNSLAQGKGPDIFSFHNSWVPMFKEDLDIIPQSVISMDDYAKNYYPVIVKNLTTAEGVVGIPLEYDAIALFVNEDIFSSAGKIFPRTWDQFHQLAVDLTTRGNQGLIIQSGASLGLTGNVDYWPEVIGLLLLQDKVNLVKPSGSLAEEALGYYADYVTFDKVWDNTLPNSTQAFAEGKVAMYFAPIRAVDAIRKINKNLKFRTIEVPQIRRDDPSEPDVSYATYWVQGVWNKSSNKSLAWDFLKFISTNDSLQKIYKSSQSQGLSGEPYPYFNMRDLLINDSIMGSVLALAPNAGSGYLADKTNDGTVGLNTQLSGIYKIAIDGLVATRNRKGIKPVVDKIAEDSAKVFAKYGITP